MPVLTRSLVDYYRALPAWAAAAVLFIGTGWLRAAAEKVVDPQWWTGGTIDTFLAEHEAVPFYSVFTAAVVSQRTTVFAWLVFSVQLLVGLALLLGWRPKLTLAAGIALNLQFVLAGAVNPSAFYVVIQGAVLLWLVEDDRPAARERAIDWLVGVAVCTFFACAPFIRTLHPAGSIDDPALVLCFLALLAIVAAGLSDASGGGLDLGRRAGAALEVGADGVAGGAARVGDGAAAGVVHREDTTGSDQVRLVTSMAVQIEHDQNVASQND